MRAVVVKQFGLDGTSLDDVASPTLVVGDIRIAVQSSGVSFANLLAIEGRHQNKAEPPFTPGTEVAGVVLECAPGVTLFQPGDRVVAAVSRGGYAEEAVAPERNVFALPERVDFDAATHFPTIYATAYAALIWRARLQPGETLLVHGAAGGSGLAAIEIGRVLGAKVIANAGSEDKLRAAVEHGAHVGIDYRTSGFRDRVLDETSGRGADVIFDPVGGATFDESLRCIAPDGRLIPMGFAGGTIPNVPANIVLVKNITVIGLYWGYYLGWARQAPPEGTAQRVRGAFDEMLQWAAAGRLRPRTSNIFSLTQYAEALATLSSRSVVGRSVLRP